MSSSVSSLHGNDDDDDDDDDDEDDDDDIGDGCEIWIPSHTLRIVTVMQVGNAEC